MRFFRSLNKCIISQTFVEKRFNNSNILGLSILMKRKLNINTVSGTDSNLVSIFIYYDVVKYNLTKLTTRSKRYTWGALWFSVGVAS